MQVVNFMYGKLFKGYLKNHPLDIDAKAVLKKTAQEFKAMIQRTPGLDGKGMEFNLVGSCWLFAMAKSIPEMTPELFCEITEDFVSSDMMKKMCKKTRKKGLLFTDKAMAKWAKDAEESQDSQYEMDWIYTFKWAPDTYDINYTKCGCHRLAQRENMMEYLPGLCHTDFTKYKLKGAKLTRNHTLANGDGYCDFHFDRIKE